MTRSVRTIATLLAFAASVASAQTTAITGATVHTVGPAGTLEHATVVIENGRIAAVGTGIQVPAGALVIDARGKIVTPGLFSAMGQLGLSEVGAVAGTNDAVQRGDEFSAGFDVARYSVVTSSRPGSMLRMPTTAARSSYPSAGSTALPGR